MRVSRQYRSVIKDCQEQLEHLAETGAASQASHYLAQVGQNEFQAWNHFYLTILISCSNQCLLQSELMYKLELIWHLVEILFMDSSPGGLVMPHLLNWVSLHFPACEERARFVFFCFLIHCNPLCNSPAKNGVSSPGLSCHRAATARSSTATTGKLSLSSSSKVASTRLEISSASTLSSPPTRSPPSTSCCARCHCAVRHPRQPSLSSVGELGKWRLVDDCAICP